jgi:hypothetical protein
LVHNSSFSKKDRIAKIKNAETCYVLGNGPSLKQVLEKDINLFKNGFVLVCNDFALSEYYTLIKPAYYLLSDPTYFNKFNIAEHKKQTDQLYEIIRLKTDWNITFIIPFQHYKSNYLQSILNPNKNIHIQFYNTTPVFCNQKLRFKLYDWGLGKPSGSNILVSCVYISIFSGFKNIYLYGADHSWLTNLHVTDNNEVSLKLDNFYLNGNQNYNVWKDERNISFTMPEILSRLSYMFRAYFELNSYAKTKSIEITNCTKNSFIDAFQRPISI